MLLLRISEVQPDPPQMRRSCRVGDRAATPSSLVCALNLSTCIFAAPCKLEHSISTIAVQRQSTLGTSKGPKLPFQGDQKMNGMHLYWVIFISQHPSQALHPCLGCFSYTAAGGTHPHLLGFCLIDASSIDSSQVFLLLLLLLLKGFDTFILVPTLSCCVVVLEQQP